MSFKPVECSISLLTLIGLGWVHSLYGDMLAETSQNVSFLHFKYFKDMRLSLELQPSCGQVGRV